VTIHLNSHPSSKVGVVFESSPRARGPGFYNQNIIAGRNVETFGVKRVRLVIREEGHRRTDAEGRKVAEKKTKRDKI